jgi:uncharacterized membrane protein YhaH (DUF805 family)
MLEWMILPLKRYAEFSGRSRRKEYWSFVLLTVLVYIVLGGLMLAGGFSMGSLASMGQPGAEAPHPGALFYIGAGLLGLYGLAVFIPNLAVIIRRLHDRDMSGWWLLGYVVASIIPFLNIIAAIAMLVIMFLPGTVGPNRFGPDPKDPASAEVFS